VSSRIELTLTPSLLVGVLAVLPWLLLLVFLFIAVLAGKTWLVAAAPIALYLGTLQYRSNGLLRGGRSVNGLLIEHGKMYLKTGDKRQVEVFPSASSRVWAGLALLKLRPAGTRFQSYTTILLAPSSGRPGNVSADDFRRLRVWLRLGRSGRPST
jgi:toxin CptA